MNPSIFIAIVAVAGTAVNIVGAVKRNRTAQSVGTFIVMTSVVMAVISQI